MANLATSVIPGGMASWFDEKTMPPRRERILNIELLPLKPTFTKAMNEGEDVSLTREETRDMLAITELAVVVYLKEWTLKTPDGTPIPIPATTDEVLDLDRPLYDALTKHAAKCLAESTVKADGFSVDAVEDEDSPTVA